MITTGHPRKGTVQDTVALSECDALRADLDAKNEVIVRLTAESESYAENNRYLEAELQRTMDLLDFVEKEFVSLERGIQSNETRASAVAAVAEAELAYDKTFRTDPGAASRSNVHQAKEKVEKANELLAKRRYNGAVYFARRAIRLLEEKHEIPAIRIVSVDQANMRSGPGTKFEITEQLPLGTVLVELASQDDWFKVSTRAGIEGWVHVSVTAGR